MEVAAAAAVASALVATASFIRQGQNAGDAGGINAEIASKNAQIERDRANAEAHDIAIQNRKALGSIRAGAGASGLLVEDGSPLEAVLDSAATGELNVRRRIWQGELQGRAAEVDAYTAGLKGQNAAFSAYANAGSSLLTAGSKAAGLFASSGSKSAEFPIGGGHEI